MVVAGMIVVSAIVELIAFGVVDCWSQDTETEAWFDVHVGLQKKKKINYVNGDRQKHGFTAHP